jgi:hypothetical protein
MLIRGRLEAGRADWTSEAKAYGSALNSFLGGTELSAEMEKVAKEIKSQQTQVDLWNVVF